jgi:hypothetical protein
MAVIDTGYLAAVAQENQRLVETAKGLWYLMPEFRDEKGASQLKEQVNRLLDISERISAALANAR